MNFFFNGESDSEDELDISVETEQPKSRRGPRGDVEDADERLTNLVKKSTVNELNLRDKDANVAKDSKDLVMAYVELALEESRDNGMSSEETLAKLSSGLGRNGKKDQDGNKLSKKAIQKVIETKRRELQEFEQAERLKALQRQRKENDDTFLDSIKMTADSTALNDRHIAPTGKTRGDRTDYSSNEFTSLKYTPVCCDGPADFEPDGYKMRCLSETGRRPRLMVVITMYNEPPEQLRSTLRAVGNNILFMQTREQRFNGMGLDVWKDVVVCVVSDGRTKVRQDTLEWFEGHGMFDEQLMKFKVDDLNAAGEEVLKPTSMHLFERTVLLDKRLKGGIKHKRAANHDKSRQGQQRQDFQGTSGTNNGRGANASQMTPSESGAPQQNQPMNRFATSARALKRKLTMAKVNKDGKMAFERTAGGRLEAPKEGQATTMAGEQVVQLPPMQLVFALKEKNAQKLNSHFWFFEGFCKEIEPEYCIMLDVGTMPTHTAFTLLLNEMTINKQVGATCGEIVVDKPFSDVRNWVKMAQHFEYKVSNFLDKAHESAFGYISVLPGAFSAYRYIAIQGPPLARYFAPLRSSVDDMGPFKGNMYLAEDRILCIEIVAKRGENWLLSYVKDARARTDVPDDLNSLILQRRRWINGSFFASVYALMNYYRVFTESAHDSVRKFALFLQLIYQCAVFGASWFQIALFVLTVYFVMVDGLQPGSERIPLLEGLEIPPLVFTLFMFGYSLMLLSQIVLALGNKLKYTEKFYTVISYVYGVVMVLVLVLTTMIFFYIDPNDIGGVFVVVSAALSLGSIFIASIFHGEFLHIATTIVQYLILLPVLVNVLSVYSMSNLHDLSWGTKGLEETELKDTTLKIERMRDDLGSKYSKLAPEDVEFLSKERHRQELADLDDIREKQFKRFRTLMLLFYLGCQFAAVYACVEYVDSNTYFQFFAIFVGGVNSFKLMGSLYFLFNTWQRRVRFWFFIQCGLRSCLGFNANEVDLRTEMLKERDGDLAGDDVGQIDALFQGEAGDNLLFVKENQEKGINVRETNVYDRSFLGGRV